MRRSELWLFVVISISALFRAAISNAEPGHECNAALYKLTEFVSVETDYELSSDCPGLRQTAAFDLNSLFTEIYVQKNDVLAAYVPQTKEILIRPQVDLDTVLGRSYLVHELVHAAQLKNKERAADGCSGLLEGEAYLVQARYLRQNGAHEDALTFEIIGLLQSACAHPYYR